MVITEEISTGYDTETSNRSILKAYSQPMCLCKNIGCSYSLLCTKSVYGC